MVEGFKKGIWKPDLTKSLEFFNGGSNQVSGGQKKQFWLSYGPTNQNGTKKDAVVRITSPLLFLGRF